MTKKLLIAFDFDDTLVTENSDLYIHKLVPDKEKIPDSICQLYSMTCWTKYMDAFCRFLHEKGVQRDKLLSCVEEIELVPGMRELLHFIADKNCDAIIISDANSVFIEQILRKTELMFYFQKIYTNPAAFDLTGCLKIDGYHEQDWCDLSTVNLCKGHVLEAHIAEQKKCGITYDVVAYVGDGGNDLCPVLRLKDCDVVFPRKGYRLSDKIASSKYQIHAKVKLWETGFEIEKELQSLFK